jgi:hypothetical protein
VLLKLVTFGQLIGGKEVRDKQLNQAFPNVVAFIQVIRGKVLRDEQLFQALEKLVPADKFKGGNEVRETQPCQVEIRVIARLKFKFGKFLKDLQLPQVLVRVKLEPPNSISGNDNKEVQFNQADAILLTLLHVIFGNVVNKLQFCQAPTAVPIAKVTTFLKFIAGNEVREVQPDHAPAKLVAVSGISIKGKLCKLVHPRHV